MAITEYGGEFASAAHNENKYGIQFHPEKAIIMVRFCYIILQNFENVKTKNNSESFNPR
jgi:imidazoleglycerol phosphate synthase glutamine amidotransferase subunit HisH